MSVFPGNLQPKNQIADIVDQERERIQMQQEPHNSVVSKKAMIIRIVGAVIIFAVGRAFCMAIQQITCG